MQKKSSTSKFFSLRGKFNIFTLIYLAGFIVIIASGKIHEVAANFIAKENFLPIIFTATMAIFTVIELIYYLRERE